MKKYRFGKIYVEITNVCNLNCSFCHGTAREKHFMPAERFAYYLEQVKGLTPLIYLHVMGEPLLHPELETILDTAHKMGVRVNMTTNGTLLTEKKDVLLRAGAPERINISLHAAEGNSGMAAEEYIRECLRFVQERGEAICCLRLWNKGTGEQERNAPVLALLKEAFPEEWQPTRKGFRLAKGVYLEYAARFDWPDPDAQEDPEKDVFCFALRDQMAILADGTVVPCCLDADGNIALGDLNRQSIEEILSSPRAQALYAGFERRQAV